LEEARNHEAPYRQFTDQRGKFRGKFAIDRKFINVML
jgi:hypothetical protein